MNTTSVKRYKVQQIVIPVISQRTLSLVLLLTLLFLFTVSFAPMGSTTTLTLPSKAAKFTRFILNPAIKIVNKILSFPSLNSSSSHTNAYHNAYSNSNLTFRSHSAFPLPILFNLKNKPTLVVKFGSQHRMPSNIVFNNIGYETLTKNFGNPNQELQRNFQNKFEVRFGVSICF